MSFYFKLKGCKQKHDVITTDDSEDHVTKFTIVLNSYWQHCRDGLGFNLPSHVQQNGFGYSFQSVFKEDETRLV